jgi:hypothetical protein
MKRTRAVLITVPALVAGLVAGTGTGVAAGHAGTRATTFAFKASGFGTRLIGGQVPAGSSTTGFRALGCTNLAGKSHTNDVASATIPGLGTASGVRTRDWTTSRHGVVASHSIHAIAHVTLASSGVGSLTLDAVKAKATAFHNASGFHSSTTTRIGGITFTPPVGGPQSFPAPTPDQPVTIPGLATISLGAHSTSHTATSAAAAATALRVDVIPSGTSVQVAKARAELASGLTMGIFGGRSAATHVITAAGDIAKSGPNPLSQMPCQGTGGKTRQKSLASGDLGGQLVVKGAHSSQWAAQRPGRAHGYEKGGVATVNLGHGQLVVKAIVGRANVTRTPQGVVTSARGTRLGSVTASGKKMTFPPTGVLEIPGVAKLERKVVTRSHDGISVIGLRITLLDGSGAVVDLGEARMRIGRLPG